MVVGPELGFHYHTLQLVVSYWDYTTNSQLLEFRTPRPVDGFGLCDGVELLLNVDFTSIYANSTYISRSMQVVPSDMDPDYLPLLHGDASTGSDLVDIGQVWHCSRST